MKTGESTERLLTAEAWVARLGAPDISSREREAFLQWCSESVENVSAYERVASLHGLARHASANASIETLSSRALAGPRARRFASRGYRFARLVAIAALLVLVAVPLMRLHRGKETESPATAYVTAQSIRHLALADGTGVILDADTAIEVRFDEDRRSVRLLRGRAQFSVARAKPPFEVAVGDAIVRDVGTIFQVSTRDSASSVALLDGQVAITRSHGAAVADLHRGERLDMGADGAVRRHDADVPAVEAWTTGRLVFRDAATKDLIDTMNRYASRKIRLENAAYAEARVTGSFHAGDQEAVVHALSTTWSLRVKRNGDEIVLY